MSPDDFIARHAEALLTADADALAQLYAPDATLVALDGVAEGQDAVRDRYRTFFEYHGAVASAETTHRQTVDQSAFTRLRIESDRGRFDLVNVFELDGDVCRRHFSNEIEVLLNRAEVERDV